MVHYCLRDDRSLENMGHKEILGKQVNVCRCPGCGEVTFWSDYEELKKSTKAPKLEEPIQSVHRGGER